MTKRVEDTKAEKFLWSENLERMNKELAALSNSVPEEDENLKRHRTILSYVSTLQRDYEVDLNSWPTSEFYFSDLPTALTETMSDADGHFTLHLAAGGSYIVAAQGERRLGENTEQYYWLVRFEVSSEHDTTLLLANHNTTTSTSKESVVACKGNMIRHNLDEIPKADHAF